MNIEHYLKFKECEEKGLKKEASKSIRAFISSFDGKDEIDNWVWEYLPGLSTNRSSRIRHEIFHELVLPVLKAGYKYGDFSCTLWLGKLIQNIYQSRKTHEDLGWITEIELYNKCHKLDPGNEEARLLFKAFGIVNAVTFFDE